MPPITTSEHRVTVAVDISTAFEQWTRFEQFPQFMEHLEHVEQLDATTLRWTVVVPGEATTFDVEVTEQVDQRRIAWRIAGDGRLTGVVTFHEIDPGHTSVMLRVGFDPLDRGDGTPDPLGVHAAAVAGDLRRFRQLVEQRGGGPPDGAPGRGVSDLGGSLQGRPLHTEDGPADG